MQTDFHTTAMSLSIKFLGIIIQPSYVRQKALFLTNIALLVHVVVHVHLKATNIKFCTYMYV